MITDYKNMWCGEHSACGSTTEFNGTPYWFLCNGENGWVCERSSDCVQADPDDPMWCADWIDDNEDLVWQRCSDQCGSKDEYKNEMYTIQCFKKEGEECDHRQGCDPLHKLKCADIYHDKNHTYENEPKCIKEEGCGKIIDTTTNSS